MASTKTKSSKSLDSFLEKYASKGTNIDAIRKDKETGGKKGSKGGSRFYKVPVGETTIRVLPALHEDDLPWYETGYYYINGKYVYSRRFMDEDANDPIARYASKIWKEYKETEKSGSPDLRLKKEAISLFAKEQFLYNVVVRDSENGDRLEVMQTGVSIKDSLASLFLNERVGDISNVAKGRDVVISREGKGIATKYHVMQLDSAPLADDVDTMETFLDQRKDLASLVPYPTEEESEAELEKYLENYKVDEDDTPKKSAPSQSVNDDEEDDDVDEDALGDIDAAIAKAKKKRGK